MKMSLNKSCQLSSSLMAPPSKGGVSIKSLVKHVAQRVPALKHRKCWVTAIVIIIT